MSSIAAPSPRVLDERFDRCCVQLLGLLAHPR
jgi:hypothetical protein